MRKKKAYLSGINRLSNVQAKAICDSNERYENEYLYDFSDTDFTVSNAIGKIRNSIHEGRYVPLFGTNRLTVDEVWLLSRRIKLMQSTVSYSTGYEKRSLIKALTILENSVTKSRRTLRGSRNRFDTMWSCGDEDELDELLEIYNNQPGTISVDLLSDPDPF